MIDLDPEKAAADKLARAKHTIAVGRLRQQWVREGYDPRRHLDLATAEGDRSVLAFMVRTERDRGQKSANFACWLAMYDIFDAMGARRSDVTEHTFFALYSNEEEEKINEGAN